jgi:hypothetical protein
MVMERQSRRTCILKMGVYKSRKFDFIIIFTLMGAAHSALCCRFRYATVLKDEFLQGSISVLLRLQSLDKWGWVPDHAANVFVSNHDTERVCPFRRALFH